MFAKIIICYGVWLIVNAFSFKWGLPLPISFCICSFPCESLPPDLLQRMFRSIASSRWGHMHRKKNDSVVINWNLWNRRFSVPGDAWHLGRKLVWVLEKILEMTILNTNINPLSENISYSESWSKVKGKNHKPYVKPWVRLSSHFPFLSVPDTHVLPQANDIVVSLLCIPFNLATK